MSMPCLCCGCLPWQSSLCFNPVRWRIEKEIIGVVFTPVCKAVSGCIKCAAGKNRGPAFRTCTSQIFSLSVWRVCPSSALHRKSFLGVKYLWDCHKVWIIYCTLMARSTNWKSKIKRCCCPYLHLQHESVSLYSCDTVGPQGLSSVLWQHYLWVTLC